MKLIINGEPREIYEAGTVPELLQVLGLPGPSLLIEHNGLALHRSEWPGRQLSDGDRLEFLRITAGG